MSKPKLAIVSTFDDLCGIAGYTRALVHQLENVFDIEVFDLKQFFMRAYDKKVSLAADSMVKDFCSKAKSFDFINIQLEHGTIARTRADFVRRFTWIAEASPALSVTFHTVLPYIKLDLEDIFNSIIRLNFHEASKTWVQYRDRKAVNQAVYGVLKREARRKPVNIIVHTQREMMTMRYVYGFENVFDHPLSFFAPETARSLRATVHRNDFPGLDTLPASAKLIGVFGFLSEYKGFETAIHALRYLPEDHHLAFFGAVHPNEIRQQQKIYPYVNKLLEATDSKATAVSSSPASLSSRIHFMGALNDEDFARAMCVCDDVVLPYLEVGQSASGPMSIAVEMGARVIAARNRAFLEFERYFPSTIEMFEIGNYLELAQRIKSRPAFPSQVRHLAYKADTNRALYIAANSRR